jgi:hypothetical protein
VGEEDVMPARIMRAPGFALATALIFAGAVGPHARSQTLPSPLPADPPAFRAFTAQFRVDGTFLVEVLSLNVTGKWRAEALFVVRPSARGDVSLKDGETSNASVVWSCATRGPFTPTPRPMTECSTACRAAE